MPSEGEAVRDQATMEGRRCGPAGRVTVVYYLCRHGRHLEHPHLMELTLASPNHSLYLRDVMHRLDALRGKGMAGMYSWSCKRRYKTGFVWHDVSKDDVLLPAQSSSEYVLKGSLLPLRHSPTPAAADQGQQSVNATIVQKVQCVKTTAEEESPARFQGSHQAGWMTNRSSSSPPQQLQQPQQVLSSVSPSSSSTSKDSDQEAARSNSSVSSSSDKQTKRGSGGISPGSGCSPRRPPCLTPNKKEQKPVQSSNIAAQDIVEQTDGVPTRRKPHRTKDASAGRGGTLESLIRAEALFRRGGRGATSKRILLEDEETSSLLDDREAVHSLVARLKPANLLMRLVACGSTMSVSHHSACGFMRATHKPHYLSHHIEPPPPSPVLFPLGSLITRTETTRIRTVSESGDSGNCSCRWSVPQTVGKGDELGKGMPNSSYDVNRVSEKQAPNKGNSGKLQSTNRIIPQIIRMAPSEQPTSQTLVTITTDVRQNKVEHECDNVPSSKTFSRSNTLSDPSAAKIRSPKIVSLHDEKQKVVKIEEQLDSGARVIIQCAPILKETCQCQSNVTIS